jgi:prefoldin subunit 5
VETCAQTLGLSAEHVFPVSAQKGLVAKINGDHALLARSRLAALEQALTRELLPAKQEIVGESIATEAREIAAQVHAILQTRLAGLREQLGELSELKGKNQHVIEYMMRKVKAEKDEFERGLQQYYAVRSVFTQLTNNLFACLALEALREEIRRARATMDGAFFSRSLTEAMGAFFRAAQGSLERSRGEIGEIATMMTAMYKRFAVEQGLKLEAPPGFSLIRQEKQLARLEAIYQRQFKSLFSILTREKRVLIQQFFETVTVQVRKIFEGANRDVEHWLRAVMAPVETQVREVQLQLKRRLESVKRIHQATETLEDRIEELRHMETALIGQLAELDEVAGRIGRAVEDAEAMRAAA